MTELIAEQGLVDGLEPAPWAAHYLICHDATDVQRRSA